MSAFTARYARALADVVLQDKLHTADVERQLEDFVETLEASKELREVLQNPSIGLDSKLKLLDAMATRMQMARQTRNFLAVLLQNDRIDALNAIATDYRGEIRARLHIGEAEITSTRELDAEERMQVEREAASLAGLKIQATYRQDASLLGGIVLRIGDTVYDGSVRGRLERMRAMLIAD